MSLKTAFTDKSDVTEAVAHLREQIGTHSSKFLLFFASSRYEPGYLAKQISTAFPGVPHAGCTTAGELISGKMSQGAIVAMSFDQSVIKNLSVQVVEEMAQPEKHLPDALNRFSAHFGLPLNELPADKFVGIVLTDGMSLGEERFMDALGNYTDLLFVGGSAGDDLAFQKTYVITDGKAYAGAALLAVLQPTGSFDILKTQSFQPSDKILTPTKVNEAAREVLEFNHEPAKIAYAKAVGIEPEKAGSCFMSHPLGLMADGEPFVRSPQQFRDDKMVFYCSVTEGMELSLLNAGDIIADTAEALRTGIDGSVAAMINFHCILRTLELREKNLEPAYAKLFESVPTIGFSTYGEQFIGHINQTSTILVFRN